MNIRSKLTRLVTISIALIALVVVGTGWTTKAQQGDTLRGTTLVGFIPGQTMRFSMGNLSIGGPVRAQVSLYDAQGNLVVRSQEVAVSPSHFHSFDFKRTDLALAGEPNTGRLQLRAEVQFQRDANQTPIPPNRFPVTVELLDSRTGGTYFTGTITVSDDG